MSSVEDQVRAATRAEAETLLEVRPLRLPPASGELSGPRAGARARRLRTWIAPVAAAAAVIALAISLVLVRSTPNGHAVPPARPVPASGGVPQYYVVPVPQGKSANLQELVVGDTFTGARLATLSPPRGSTFLAVTAAADDRTFVVAAQPLLNPRSPDPYQLLAARTWYLLRIAPGTSSPARLTRLAIPGLKGGGLVALALSGSGRELAVGFIPNFKQPWNSPILLRIYSVTTGKLERAWSTRDKTVFGGPGGDSGTLTTQVTWVDNDRALAFSTHSMTRGRSRFEEVTHETLRLLDMSAGGSDLMADSRVIWSAQAVSSAITGYGQLSCANVGGNPMITADGKTIVCAAFKSPSPPVSGTAPGRWTLAWLAYSTSAPTVARTVAELSVYATGSNPPEIALLWAGPAGGPLIGEWSGGSWPSPTPPPADRPRVGVVSGGKFRQLPTPPAAVNFSVVW